MSVKANNRSRTSLSFLLLTRVGSTRPHFTTTSRTSCRSPRTSLVAQSLLQSTSRPSRLLRNRGRMAAFSRLVGASGEPATFGSVTMCVSICPPAPEHAVSDYPAFLLSLLPPLLLIVALLLRPRVNYLEDYAALFLGFPFITRGRFKRVEPPFYAANSALPILLSVLLGLQHALAMGEFS